MKRSVFVAFFFLSCSAWSQSVSNSLLVLGESRLISNEEWLAFRQKHKDDKLFLQSLRRYWGKALASHPKVTWPDGVSGVQFSLVQWGAHYGHRLEMTAEVYGAGMAAPKHAELRMGSSQAKNDFRSEITGVSKVTFELFPSAETPVLQWKLEWKDGTVAEVALPSPFGPEWQGSSGCPEFAIQGASSRRVMRSVLHPSGARPVWVAPHEQSPLPDEYRSGFDLQTDCIEQIHHESFIVDVIFSSRAQLRTSK